MSTGGRVGISRRDRESQLSRDIERGNVGCNPFVPRIGGDEKGVCLCLGSFELIDFL